MNIDSQQYYSRVHNEYVLAYCPISARKVGENRYLIIDANREDTLLDRNELVAMCERRTSEGVIKCVDFVFTSDGFHRYMIDGTLMPDEIGFHREIAMALHFFDSCGMNLDALWDVSATIRD